MLAAGGVLPKVAQQLMRHSTITLTMDRYTHSFVGDDRTALEALPRYEPGEQSSRATGTDGRLAAPLAPELSDDGRSCPTMANTNPRGATETPIEARPGGLEPPTPGLGIRVRVASTLQNASL